MGDVIELPGVDPATSLRRVSTRLAEGSRVLRAQSDTLTDQTAALGALRETLRAQAAEIDEIASLAGAIEAAILSDDTAALDVLQVRLQDMMATGRTRVPDAVPRSDAAD